MTIPPHVLNTMVQKKWGPVKALREYRNLSEQEMAARLGIPVELYKTIETTLDRHREVRSRIAAVLNVDPQDLKY